MVARLCGLRKSSRIVAANASALPGSITTPAPDWEITRPISHSALTDATIGRAAAVAQFGRIHISGFLAWLAWLFVHILFLIGFRNRVLVFIQWAWSYFTYERGARLITGSSGLPGWDVLRSGRAGEGEREMSSVIDK